MKPNFAIKKIWNDDELFEILVSACDGRSEFQTRIYIGSGQLGELLESLRKFKDQIHGGIYDIEFGKFGPEYASGACLVRLHFSAPGRISITFKGEGEYLDFSNPKFKVASEAKLFFHAEPNQLDSFIEELDKLAKASEQEANFYGLSPW